MMSLRQWIQICKTNKQKYVHTHTYVHICIYFRCYTVFGDVVNQQKRLLGLKPEAWWSN